MWHNAVIPSNKVLIVIEQNFLKVKAGYVEGTVSEDGG
jgi:hypothetical protein